jgi:predicted dehydrogenase
MSSMQKLRIIQVGLGVRGQKWAEVMRAHPSVEIIGYVDTRLDYAQALVSSWQEHTPCYASLDAALADHSVDAVLLVTPPDLHHEQSMLAFQHGCHVVCEKPLTEIYAESIAMVRDCT